MEEGKKSWKVIYRHAGQEFVLFEEADSIDDALSKFRASLIRLSPVMKVELEIVQ